MLQRLCERPLPVTALSTVFSTFTGFQVNRAILSSISRRSVYQRVTNPYLRVQNLKNWKQTKMADPTATTTTDSSATEPVERNSTKVTADGRGEEKKFIYKPIVWIDCEMTGLDHINDHIIEICCIITDGHLNVVDEQAYESVVHYDKSVMDAMNEWCVDHHGSSGLTSKVLSSKKTREVVEQELLAYIKKYIPDPRRGILAGNSVHMDRIFMLREFPQVIDHLFYRIIDVSSIMEVSFRHNPELASVVPKKKGAHTAKADILESIEQLRWYRKHYLKGVKETKEFVEQRRAEIAVEQQDQEERSKREAMEEDKQENKKRRTE